MKKVQKNSEVNIFVKMLKRTSIAVFSIIILISTFE